MVPNITKRLIDGTKPGEERQLVWDDELKGFGILVLPSGVKSFVVQYRNAAGRQRRLSIGRYGAFTADEARRRAREVIVAAAKGGDPLEERRSKRTAADVTELLERFLDEHGAEHYAATTLAEVTRIVRRHLIPKLGRLGVAAVTPADLARLHNGMRSTPRQANLALAIASKAFSLAEVWQLRPRHSNPATEVRRFAEVERERFLTADELGRLGATVALAQTEGLPWQLADGEPSKHLPKDAAARRTAPNADAIAVILLLLFTGARLSEILTLRWAEVDLAGETIELPARKGKGRRPHPISEPALEILRARRLAKRSKVGGSAPWVFARASDPTEHISKDVVEDVWRKLRRHAKLDDVRLHDLRHTVGTYAGQQSNNAFLIRDLLRHRNVAVTARYVSRDVDPLRKASAAIGERIQAGLKGGTR